MSWCLDKAVLAQGGGGGNCPQLLGFATKAPYLLLFFEPALVTYKPMGGQLTHLSTSGGFPPQEADPYRHPEKPTGIPFQPLWHPPPKPIWD